MSRFLRICNQSLQKVLKRAKKNLYKNSIWVSKNAEFHADFESRPKFHTCQESWIFKRWCEITCDRLVFAKKVSFYFFQNVWNVFLKIAICGDAKMAFVPKALKKRNIFCFVCHQIAKKSPKRIEQPRKRLGTERIEQHKYMFLTFTRNF